MLLESTSKRFSARLNKVSLVHTYPLQQSHSKRGKYYSNEAG